MSLFKWPWSNRRGKVIWGKYEIPQSLVNYHFFAAGTTGSGKSTLLRILYRSVLPDVKNKALDTRALFYDPKSEAYPDLVSLDLGHEAVILNPFDSRCSAWDMASDIRSQAQAQEFAALMVPPVEGPNKYFYDGSRMLLETAVFALVKVKGKDWGFRDVLLACANMADLKTLAERAGIIGVKPIEDFLDESREAKSVRMTLTIENNSYGVIAAAWELARCLGRTFTLRDWVEGRGPQILLLGASEEFSTSLATVNRLIVQRARQLLLSYSKKNARTGRRTWVFLDEFPTLGTIPNLERFLTEGRSRGICAVLGFQHIAHLEKTYGKLANAILGQCSHQAYLYVNDVEMAKWSASQFGRLISYDDDGNIKQNDPAATENTFMQELQPATEKGGFQCIIRSPKDVLPDGPKRLKVPPRRDLAELDSTVRALKDLGPDDWRRADMLGFQPWEMPLELEPWNESERRALGLDPRQQAALGVPLPAINIPADSFVVGPKLDW